MLSTDAATYWRAIRVGSGYVPSDSPRVHFGFPRDQRARSLRVWWPKPLSGKLSVRLGQDCTASSTCSGGQRHEPEPMDSAGAGEACVRVTAVAYEHGPSLAQPTTACERMTDDERDGVRRRRHRQRRFERSRPI